MRTIDPWGLADDSNSWIVRRDGACFNKFTNGRVPCPEDQNAKPFTEPTVATDNNPCSALNCLSKCTDLLIDTMNNDISPIFTGLVDASLIGAFPLYKPMINIPVSMGASDFTNPTSLLGFQNPSAMMDKSASVLGKASRNRAYGLGRANSWLATGLVIFGGSAIVGCTYQCLDDQVK